MLHRKPTDRISGNPMQNRPTNFPPAPPSRNDRPTITMLHRKPTDRIPGNPMQYRPTYFPPAPPREMTDRLSLCFIENRPTEFLEILCKTDRQIFHLHPLRIMTDRHLLYFIENRPTEFPEILCKTDRQIFQVHPLAPQHDLVPLFNPTHPSTTSHSQPQPISHQHPPRTTA